MVAEPQIPQELPFLQAICWQTVDVKHLRPEEMLRRYERGWSYRAILEEINPEELLFIKELIQRYGSWLVTDV